MVAVGDGDMASSSARLKVVFAHESTNLVIDDHASMGQFAANAPPSVILEFVKTTRPARQRAAGALPFIT